MGRVLIRRGVHLRVRPKVTPVRPLVRHQGGPGVAFVLRTHEAVGGKDVEPVGVQRIDRDLSVVGPWLVADKGPVLAGVGAAEQPDDPVGRGVERVGVAGPHKELLHLSAE